MPTNFDDWTSEERRQLQQLRAGHTVVVNMNRSSRFWRFAKRHGLAVRIDRQTKWGNPFLVPDDGDRATVVTNYADYYLSHKPSLADRTELAGKALGCWCAPLPCHGDVLAESVGRVQR